MNNNYRLVWNHISQDWQPVSELKNRRTKPGAAMLAPSLLVSSLLASASALAETNQALTTPAAYSVNYQAIAQNVAPIAIDKSTLPTQGEIKVGQGAIHSHNSDMVINQTSQKLGIDWQSFSIGKDASVTFVQPGQDAVALNRVVGHDVSYIFGKLSSNGQVFLTNTQGVLFAENAQVDVGGIVASGLDLSQADFANGNYHFTSELAGKVSNEADINVAVGGYAALFGSEVENNGAINVPYGEVILASGRAVAVDITGNNLISAVITQGAHDAKVTNSGELIATAGTVRMDAQSAQSTVGAIVNNDGIIRANSIVEQNGEIWLMGDVVSSDGELSADGADSAQAGHIHIQANAVALGGNISVDGSEGGTVNVVAGDRLSLAQSITARGYTGDGGHIELASAGGIIESSSSVVDARGQQNGGELHIAAAAGIASSGKYLASGQQGNGGQVDVTANSIHMLSASVDASGAKQGGLVRIGGEFQGGKNNTQNSEEIELAFVERWQNQAELTNASRVFINDGTQIDVSASQGQGGTAVVWANDETTFLGQIDAQGAAGTQLGGAVEISSGQDLKKAELSQVHIGQGGQLLLDPKNLIIGSSDDLSNWQYQAVLESVYAWKATTAQMQDGDQLGSSLALSEDASRLAIGAMGDDGAANNRSNAGAVHLYRFTDSNFSGGELVGSIGQGYLGGDNINISLDAQDNFGSALAFDDVAEHLVIGSKGDDGLNNSINDAGAVYLFTFAESDLTGGQHIGTLGAGYTGVANVSLEAFDQFGSSVALSDSAGYLAVGAQGDDGQDNSVSGAGAVHLLTFGADSFASATMLGTIGSGYTGTNDFNISLDSNDSFGAAVALNSAATSLLVGASGDDGSANSVADAGAVYQINFGGGAFSLPFINRTMGAGYTGTDDIDLSSVLDADDAFGSAIAVSDSATEWLIGAPGDDGQSNVLSNSGAIYLFDFSYSQNHRATLGVDYSHTNSLDLLLRENDNFGSAIAVNSNATRVVAGAVNGVEDNSLSSSPGSLHFFNFSTSGFNSGSLVARLTNQVSYQYQASSSTNNDSDYIGTSVVLSDDATLLAIGASGDDGFDNLAANTGAVYLIKFADGNFANADLIGILGEGYSGVNNLDIDLDGNDQFGSSIALSGDNRNLVVGARRDDGFDNESTDSGAVYLFRFSDAAFSNIAHLATIGDGYNSGKDVDVAQLDSGDHFGAAVALNEDGSGLAIGSPLDRGLNNSGSYQSGSVYLFSFTDAAYTDGSHVATIGDNYIGTNDIQVSLDSYDYFGQAISLNSDGTRMAVGAYGGAGASNAAGDSGEVYLFSFTDSNFTSGTHSGTLGVNHSGTRDLDVSNHIANSDYFGYSLALNADASRLVVGSYGDDGASNNWDSGAVHLITFSDSDFNNAAHVGKIGFGYQATGDLDLTSHLNNYDYFGAAVALNADASRLVVGANRDDGRQGNTSDFGAVHLISFTDTSFSQASLSGSIGDDYQAAASQSFDLVDNVNWSADNIGDAIAFNADASLLAIGVSGDDGFGVNNYADSNYGAVHLIQFANNDYTQASLIGTLGYGYVGSQDLDLTTQLDANDNFGSAVSLNASGDRLAVGAQFDDGANNNDTNAGAVYLFRFTDNSFGGASHFATIGEDYTGSNDLDLSAVLDSYDNLGSALAFNADATRLAIGVRYDDGLNNSYYRNGAVYLIGFSDSDFAAVNHIATLGSGYVGTNDINLSAHLSSSDYFGYSLAFNSVGDRLVVSAQLDDGASDNVWDSGAVYLLSFTDTSYSDGLLVGKIGDGYSNTGDIDFSEQIDNYDYFGSSLALSADGRKLVIGSRYDDGFENAFSNRGAAFILDFADTSFASGTLSQTLGAGYIGTNDINIHLNASYELASALALSADGQRLAIGAQSNNADNLLLFDLSTTQSDEFLALSADITDEPLSVISMRQFNGSQSAYGEFLGQALALSDDATRLAIGVPEDDGFNPNGPFDVNDRGYGAVHLVSFTDGNFAGASLTATIGSGYVGSKDIALNLDSYDYFGYSVAFNADASRLAVGALLDDGDGGSSNSGAVYLFTFDDSDFSNGQHQATLGEGYSGAKDLNLSLDSSDYFGASVALNGLGDRLAVGAERDNGFNNTLDDPGAVYLFTFTDTEFGGVSHVGTLGEGYVATGDLDLSASLDSNDYFGASLALSADATRLAIGAKYDDGFENSGSTAGGAVYLISFTDSAFAGATHTATIGENYVGTNDINIDNNSFDYLGWSVALSSDASRLAVGVPDSDGFEFATFTSGRVDLFSFSDTAFSSGSRIAIIGDSYVGEKDYNLNLDADRFGYSVTLNGDASRLMVGALNGDGLNNQELETGEIYGFSFSDTDFSDASQALIIGSGYDGANRFNSQSFISGTRHYAGDSLGSAVALNDLGNLMAIGAANASSATLDYLSYGAVYLYEFASDDFTRATLKGVIGKGYSGGNNLALDLDVADGFGSSIALNADGSRLAVGAPQDDGANDDISNAGAVHLFSFSNTQFAGGQHVATIGAQYNTGQDVDVALNIEAEDNFGASVSLSHDASRLAVGATGDDGFDNTGAFNDGAVHLFSFADSAFASGNLSSTLGNGYIVNNDLNISLDFADNFGSAVAFSSDASRLVIGAIGDDGKDNTGFGGGVYLISFSDTAFSLPVITGMIGHGYDGDNDIDISSQLNFSDNLGKAVALSNDASRLVVAANGDDGLANSASESSGAVHLFSFANGSFGSGLLTASIGEAYVSGKDLDLELDSYDLFGSALALSGDARRLVVGAPGDDGFANNASSAGSFYLIEFNDTAFSQGEVNSLIGDEHPTIITELDTIVHGSGSVQTEALGAAVAVNADATLMALGVPQGVSGSGNLFEDNLGSVHLFQFAQAGDFSGATLISNIGHQYLGSQDINLDLDADDRFGSALALNATGDRLAVGAEFDDGYRNQADNTGAVYLFSFTDAAFSNGSHTATIGEGYANTLDINLSDKIDNHDYFGSSVALSADASRLVIGAREDDGFNNTGPSFSGAAYLISFSDSHFGGGNHTATIGAGYVGANDLDLSSKLDYNDGFAASLALSNDATRLVVGAYLDDGFENTGANDSGAVYLISFADGNFNTPSHTGTIGEGYQASHDLSLDLDGDDHFGRSVALNGSASRLAVGAPRDDGANNQNGYVGAVYLFNFGDGHYANAQQVASLGVNYQGLNDLDIDLSNSDYFGSALALSDDGQTLFVGATGDDGAFDNNAESGTIYSVRFSDLAFSNAELIGNVGENYITANSLSLDNETSDIIGEQFSQVGQAIALNNDASLMAVGMWQNDGYQVSGLSNTGAVYLFSFNSNSQASASLQAIIGKGYSGGKNFDLDLEQSDYFGTSVAFNGIGNRLAVGATGDDGFSQTRSGSGAVYLFSFSDNQYNDTSHVATLGYGYTGTGDLDFSNNISYSDELGSALALSQDGTRLAIGAHLDDGFGNTTSNVGAVYLVSFADGNFASPSLTGVIGHGYTADNDLDLSANLNSYDYFGGALALNADGSRLAIGAVGDDAADDLATESGAVHLIRFADTSFSSPSHFSSVGVRYTGDNDIDLDGKVDTYDSFGSAIALSHDASRLFVGAQYDDGFSNNYSGNSGAVYQFDFADSAFSNGQHVATLGEGYVGAQDLNLSLAGADYFGSGLALSGDGSRLAVGATGSDITVSSGGAVYLFAYSNEQIVDWHLLPSAKQVAFSTLSYDPADAFGSALAVNDDFTRLAVGASGDDGYLAQSANNGAVHLFSFAANTYSGASLNGTIGKGFSGGNNLDINLRSGDGFGSALAMSSDASLLAVGAPFDDGSSGDFVNTGAVHLFGFSDSDFSGVQRLGSLGADYAGGKDLTVDGLSHNDNFGSALALSGNGLHLVVGATGDDGFFNDAAADTGAAYLYTFTSDNFTGINQVGIAGRGYQTSGDINLGLEDGDKFGSALALSNDALLLAVGATGDDGSANATIDAGAVYLYQFASTGFTGASLNSTLGANYTTANDINLATFLDSNDALGSALALSNDGNVLAIGAQYDDGDLNAVTNSGAVYIYDFINSDFSSPTLDSKFGRGYTGSGNLNVAVEQNDRFGAALALNGVGDKIAVGLPGRDLSSGFTLNNTGGVFLFGPPSVDLNGFNFADDQSATGSVSIESLVSVLSAGTDITLQANNDITLANDLVVSGTNGGNISFMAGRTIALFGDLTSANGDVLLKANATTTDGVIASERDTGAAGISMASGTSINAGTGAVHVLLADGDGLNDNTSGAISLRDITAQSIVVENLGPAAGSDLVLDGVLSATDDVLLATLQGNLQNNHGADAVSSSSGRWLIYTGHWQDSTEGGLVGVAASAAPRIYNTTYVDQTTANGALAGNHIFYRSQPTVDIAADDFAFNYGDTVPTFTYQVSGLVADDGVTDTLSVAGISAVTLSEPTVNSQGRHDAGIHAITVNTTQDLTNYGYNLTTDNGQLTVNQKHLTLSDAVVSTKVYDGLTSATVEQIGTISGVLSGDDVSADLSGAIANFVDKNVANDKRVGITNVSLSGLSAGNYSVTDLSATASITPKTVTLLDFTANDKVYNNNNIASFNYGSLDGLVGTETLGIFSSSATFTDDNVGTDKTVTLTGGQLSNGLNGGLAANYVLADVNLTDTANITPRDLTVWVSAIDKVYDGSTSADAQVTLYSFNDYSSDDLTFSGDATFADKNVGVDKTITVNNIGLSGADAANYNLLNVSQTYNSADITQRELLVTLDAQDKVYDGTTSVVVNLTDDRVLGDSLTINGDSAFLDKNVASNKTVALTNVSLSGADAGNYSVLTSFTSTANITAKDLSLAGVKVYDATTLVAANDLGFVGLVLNDDVTLAGTGLTQDKNVATGKTLTLDSFSLAGTDAGNYSLSSGQVDITPKAIPAFGSQEYDASINVQFGNLALNDIHEGDVISLGGSSTMADKHVGQAKVLTTGSLTLSGTDAANYSLASATVDITPKILSVTGVSASDKVYDGTTSAQISGSVNFSASFIDGDDVALNQAASIDVEFIDKNVGLDKTLIITGDLLTGSDAANYQATATATANISARDLNVSFNADDKVYDGTTAAVNTISSDDRILGDELTITGEASFSDKHVGTDKTVTLSNIQVTGADAGNYNVVSDPTALANITKRDLAVTFEVDNKVYDGTTTGSASNFADDRVVGDTLTLAADAVFADKNVGVGIAATLSNVLLSGDDANNYQVVINPNASADISQRALNIDFSATNKIYDGNTTTTSTITGDDRVAGDDLSLSATAAFGDKNAGINKAVFLSNIQISGNDAANYRIATAQTALADITPRDLNVSINALDKVYDGTTTALFTATDDRLVGDQLSVGGNANFSDKHVAVDKAVSISEFVLTGVDAGNYNVITQIANSTATISVRDLQVTFDALDKVYDGTNAALYNSNSNLVVGDDIQILGDAVFADKNVGTNKQVSYNVSLSGADVSNYNLVNANLTDTAAITPKDLALSLNAEDKIYDGTTSVIFSLSDDRVVGDDLTISADAAFADKNAGQDKLVSLSNIALTGVDVGNYIVSQNVTDLATINRKELLVTVGVADKIYDGTRDASFTEAAQLSGSVIDGDDVTVGSVDDLDILFSDKNVGTDKAMVLVGDLFSGSDGDNYQAVTHSTASITPRTLNVTISADDKVYDGTTLATVNTADDRINGDDLSIVSTGLFNDKNVGQSKTVTLSTAELGGDDALNYIVTDFSATTTASITPRDLSASITVNDKIYDGTRLANITINDDRIAGDSLTLSGDDSLFANKHVGENKDVTLNNIQVAGIDALNYNLITSSASGQGRVTPRDLNVSITAQDKVYDGTTSASVSQTDNRVTGDDLTLNVGNASFNDKHAATNKLVTLSGISISGADADNYIVNQTASDFADITQRELTVTLTADNKVYDSLTTAVANITSDNRIAGDELNFVPTAEFDNKHAASGKTVSLTHIALSGADAGNYQYVSGSATTSADISQRDLLVTIEGQNKIYDGSTTAISNVVSDNRISGDDISFNPLAKFADKHVSQDKAVTLTSIGLTGADAGNYNVAVDATALATASITPRDLTIGINALDKIYDGTTSAVVTPFDDRVAGDELLIMANTANFADKNVGNNKAITYSQIVISGADAGNYNLLNTTASTSANITPRDLLVSISALDKIYDGTSLASANVVSDDRVVGDDLTFALSALFNDKHAANNKTVTLTDLELSGADKNNYQVANTLVATTANITPRPLSLTIQAEDKIYDGLTNANATVISDNRITGDILGFVVNADFSDKQAAQDKTVSLTGISLTGADSANYDVTATTATTTANISQRDLDLSLSAQSKTYDGNTLATVDLVSDNRVAGDDLGFDISASFANKNAALDKAVSLSAVNLNGQDAPNYRVASFTTDLSATIHKRDLTLAASATDKVYDGNTNVNAVISSDDRIAGDDLSFVFDAAFSDKNVGSNKSVTLSNMLLNGVDAGNYQLVASSIGSTASITARDLNLTLGATDKVYDGLTTANASVISDDRIAGDNLAFSHNAAFNNANVGNNKPVTLSDFVMSGSDALNYKVVGQTSLATVANISPAPLTISAQDASRIYGDVNPNFSFAISGFVNGEDASSAGLSGDATFNVSADPTTAVGTYSITPAAGNLTAANYQVVNFNNGSLTITPRPLSILANNVVRFPSESDPQVFGFSSADGGLVNGDTLAAVTVPTPDGSATAVGGDVLVLSPTNATFATGNAANYQIEYLDGYMIILPEPIVNKTGQSQPQDQAFFLEIDPEEIATVNNELEQVESVVTSQAETTYSEVTAQVSVVEPTSATDNSAVATPITRARVTQISQGVSADIIDQLRSMPMVSVSGATSMGDLFGLTTANNR
ncbi:hypothetical protein C2869_09305 [Saccharobesus litoralis]|uniref:Filamentous haemagglutinin FhaB/tRNA nuclease CdiA-like TPS domain-containing protein n=1 Tax=Saccharobesus litoralis TaxID=2172099 RepID=A0A2S0VQY8_9ALTE|nr:YDG domain-containing protein [Saccharobesus litoralis]AWB66614.1 hypothetical protein C2869_09305 [Saccharobesus litoralis]